MSFSLDWEIRLYLKVPVGLLNTMIASLQWGKSPPNECPVYDTKQSNGTIYPTPPLGQDMTQGQFLSGVLTGLNSEFSFS